VRRFRRRQGDCYGLVIRIGYVGHVRRPGTAQGVPRNRAPEAAPLSVLENNGNRLLTGLVAANLSEELVNAFVRSIASLGYLAITYWLFPIAILLQTAIGKP
jgi:hypothetical protein